MAKEEKIEKQEGERGEGCGLLKEKRGRRRKAHLKESRVNQSVHASRSVPGKSLHKKQILESKIEERRRMPR